MAWSFKRKSAARAQPQLSTEIVEEKLKSFLASKSKLIAVSDITKDLNIFSSGLLDSIAFIELVLFVEKEFRVKLANSTAVNMTSLDSIGAIADAVRVAAAHRVER